MENRICLVTLFLLFCFIALPAFGQDITAQPKGESQWELYRNSGKADKLFATVTRTEAGGLSFRDASGKYVGVIQTSGIWVPWNARKRVTTIKPEEAQLYLDVLKASKTLQ